MTRRLLLLDGLIVLLGCLFAVALVRTLITPLPLPPPGEPRPVPPATVAVPEPPTAPPVGSGVYLVIVNKNLFSPSRSEGQGPSITAGPKPLLHGVVMDGRRSRAYVEDPSVQRTYGYAVGDSVAGGRVQSINGDRVIITRPDGRMELLLQDPDKPKPEPEIPAAGAPGGPPPTLPPGAPAGTPAGPAAPTSLEPPDRTAPAAAAPGPRGRVTRRLLPAGGLR
jgi:hypothetical protein